MAQEVFFRGGFFWSRFLSVLLDTCRTDCSQCSMLPLYSSIHAGCRNTLLHCFENYTGYASRSASSSGCVFWHITACMARHQRIWQTACSRHQRSSLVVIFLLSTTRRCWCRQLVGQLSTTARFWWLQRGHETGCKHRPVPPPLWQHSGAKLRPTFSVSHLADGSLSLSFQPVPIWTWTRVVNLFNLCKVPPQLFVIGVT